MSFLPSKTAKGPPFFSLPCSLSIGLFMGFIVVTLASVLVQICRLRNVSAALFACLVINSILVCVLPG